METGTNTIVSALGHGHQLMRELEAQLNPASVELCKSLAQEILASLEKAISMVKSTTGSARSFAESPCSEISEQPFRAERKEIVSKKRKTQAKWASQVKLGSGPEAEGPLEDGYSWRKYGQKEILGAKYPRGYYRCTHRNSQGCLAMKQVQRSDDNPSIFEVTYRGTHTCHLKSSSPKVQHQNNQHLLLKFQTNLKVKTENLDSKVQEPAYPSFSFKPENSPSSTLDNCFKSGFSAAFFSPTTSESNYFSSYGGGRHNLQASESDFTEIVSASTSACNSPMLDLDFLPELDPEFPFDTSCFFT